MPFDFDAAVTSPFRIQPGLRRMHDALASMSPAVLDDRGLTPVRDRLLRWLVEPGG
jgi:hypothetical protein